MKEKCALGAVTFMSRTCGNDRVIQRFAIAQDITNRILSTTDEVQPSHTQLLPSTPQMDSTGPLHPLVEIEITHMDQ